MKLLNELLLLERPAQVHVNGKLTVLTDLIEDEFGDEMNDVPFNQRCLIAQFAFTMKARLGLPVRKIIEVFLKKYIRLDDASVERIRSYGVTAQQLLDLYDDSIITIGARRMKLGVKFHAYTSVDEIISAVKSGNPVMIPFMFDSTFHRGVENFDTETGQYHAAFIDPDTNGDKRYHHVLLAIGADEESKELILRDTRPKYLFKGYVKVPFEAVKKNIKMAFSYDVDVKEL